MTFLHVCMKASKSTNHPFAFFFIVSSVRRLSSSNQIVIWERRFALFRQMMGWYEFFLAVQPNKIFVPEIFGEMLVTLKNYLWFSILPHRFLIMLSPRNRKVFSIRISFVFLDEKMSHIMKLNKDDEHKFLQIQDSCKRE